LKTALDSVPQGVTVYPSEQLITDLTFADDVVVLAETPETMQAMIDRITQAASTVGLVLNCSKSKYFVTNLEPASVNVPILIGDQTMEQVDAFTYLGSCIAPSGQLDGEILIRISRASSIFSA